MNQPLSAIFSVCVLATPSWATDWTVDASGVASDLVTIDQAMAVAMPGDRILVLPGTYPPFHFSVGVDVVGLGNDPAEVNVARVDFHPTRPIVDFEAGLSNMTVCSDGPSDGISIGGNELALGTFTVEGVDICGGIFLHGAGELYVMMVDTALRPGPGDGFLGAAFDFGGGTLDIVDSRIVAANASEALGKQAGVGLRIAGGSIVRISGSEVLGGQGDGTPALRNGGDGIVHGYPMATPVNLRLSGSSLVGGGAAAPGGTGGAGVSVTGTIQTGTVTVLGGAGSPPGGAYEGSGPTALGFDPYLKLDPAKAFAEGDVFVRPGEPSFLESDGSLPDSILGFGYTLESPSGGSLSPLTPGQIRFVRKESFGLAGARTISGSLTGLPARRLYVQAFFQDPSTGQLMTSNPVAVTIAH